MAFFTLDGPRIDPASGKAARQLVILLHGLGADGNDLIGLAPHWAEFLPDAAFASPTAPFPCDMSPMGYQWFSVQDRSSSAMLAGVPSACRMVTCGSERGTSRAETSAVAMRTVLVNTASTVQ